MTQFRYCPVCAEVLTSVFDGERDRLGCPSGHWTHWDNPLPVLAAVVEVEGRILLAQNAAWPAGTFALVTGFMERGETPEQGIARELKEETNLDAGQVTLIGNYEFIRKNEVILAYHVIASGEIRLSPELVDFRLIAPERLRPWRAGTGYALADWMRSRGHDVAFQDWPAQAPRD